MAFRNFKMIGYVIYGRGSFNQLDEILAPNRKDGKPMIFLVDHFFEGKPLVNRIPLRGNDKVIFADVTYEPKTTYVDKLANDLKEEFGTVSGVIGIGSAGLSCAAIAAPPIATIASTMPTAIFFWPVSDSIQSAHRRPT